MHAGLREQVQPGIPALRARWQRSARGGGCWRRRASLEIEKPLWDSKSTCLRDGGGREDGWDAAIPRHAVLSGSIQRKRTRTELRGLQDGGKHDATPYEPDSTDESVEGRKKRLTSLKLPSTSRGADPVLSNVPVGGFGCETEVNGTTESGEGTTTAKERPP